MMTKAMEKYIFVIWGEKAFVQKSPHMHNNNNNTQREKSLATLASITTGKIGPFEERYNMQALLAVIKSVACFFPHVHVRPPSEASRIAGWGRGGDIRKKKESSKTW